MGGVGGVEWRETEMVRDREMRGWRGRERERGIEMGWGGGVSK